LCNVREIRKGEKKGNGRKNSEEESKKGVEREIEVIH
jgi:hypothetical protein